MERMELAKALAVYLLKSKLVDIQESEEGHTPQTPEETTEHLLTIVNDASWRELLDIIADDLCEQADVLIEKHGKELTIQAAIELFGKENITGVKALSHMI